MSKALVEAITEMREEDALKLAEVLLAGGTNPLEILDAGRDALSVIGRRFEEGECFVPELIMAGEILKQLSEKAKPYLRELGAAPARLGRVVIGTVEGDIHDIGKDIVAFMLDANGFEVQDLGVDVNARLYELSHNPDNPDPKKVNVINGFRKESSRRVLGELHALSRVDVTGYRRRVPGDIVQGSDHAVHLGLRVLEVLLYGDNFLVMLDHVGRAKRSAVGEVILRGRGHDVLREDGHYSCSSGILTRGIGRIFFTRVACQDALACPDSDNAAPNLWNAAASTFPSDLRKKRQPAMAPD